MGRTLSSCHYLPTDTIPKYVDLDHVSFRGVLRPSDCPLVRAWRLGRIYDLSVPSFRVIDHALAIGSWNLPVELWSPLESLVDWPLAMNSRERERLLQGTLDLIVLRVLATIGAQHAYSIAARIQQVSDDLLSLNQGTLYPALIRLEQNGWIRGKWQRTENNRDAKYYTLSNSGQRALESETERWRRSAGLVNKFLVAGETVS